VADVGLRGRSWLKSQAKQSDIVDPPPPVHLVCLAADDPAAPSLSAVRCSVSLHGIGNGFTPTQIVVARRQART